MTTTEFTDIVYAVEGSTAVITLNRPDRLNAFTHTMQDELLAAFDLVDEDDDVRAVIVTGAGRGFCAGMDLGDGGSTFDYVGQAGTREAPDRAPRDGGGIVTLRVFRCTKPVIAAINGPAVGVGLTMTLPMDFRLVADGAKLGFVFAGRGIAPDAAASWFLPRVVGIPQALDWVLTARVFSAQEAEAAGLVREVLAPDALLVAAHEIAATIAANVAPLSAAISRGLLWNMLGADHPMVAHRADSEAIFELGQLADAHEGVEAFLEKRPARWELRPSQHMPGSYPYWTEPAY